MGVKLRAGLGVLLLVGFFVLVLGLIGGMLFVAVLGLTTGHAGGGLRVGAIAVFASIAIGTALWKVLKIKQEPYGARVERAEQPELWAMIDELAVAANTRGPDDVRIVPKVNAAVWEESHLLGLRSGKRHMMIGLPLLAGLSVSELRSVLGHELGHYSHGHTKLSAVTYRATATMQRTLAAADGWLRVLLTPYVKLYLVVARSANRAQELQADAVAVRAAGKEAAKSALGKINALDAAWSHYGDSYVRLAPEAGRTPELLMGFHAFLCNDVRHAQLLEAQESLLDSEPSSRYDSHPTMRVRIAAIDKLTGDGPATDDRPAWSVLRDPARTVPELESELIVDGLGPRASWTEVVQLGTTNIARNNAKVLTDSSVKRGIVPTGSVDEILGVVERGKTEQLMALVDGAATHAQRREVVARLIADLIAVSLIDAGKASFELDWSDTWVLRLAGGAQINLTPMVDAAIRHPTKVTPLLDWLREARDVDGHLQSGGVTS
ncbi:M48 family metallopeptidase [Actinocrispum sp. NPDC049592]|uniref:M48 family metallopeptidase n=1 Tax=Actinocrispum sp. NPDC049592 TaxID=3154835 RepID=UPI00341F7E49